MSIANESTNETNPPLPIEVESSLTKKDKPLNASERMISFVIFLS